MANLTFRNSRIVYYGPHPCANCGIDIAKMGEDWGGTAFTYPSGPIYPNTEWQPHVCDPFEVRKKLGQEARARQLAKWPHARAHKVRGTFVILGEPDPAIVDVSSIRYRYPLVISHNCNFYDTEWGAWIGADERDQRGNPTWHMNRETGCTRDTDEKNAYIDAGYAPPSAFYPPLRDIPPSDADTRKQS